MSRFITGLFSGPPKQPPATALRVSTALQGQPIPIVLGGRQRMTINLIDYFNFQSMTSGSGGGGKGGVFGGGKGQNGTTYTVSFIGAICEGPVYLVGLSEGLNNWINGAINAFGYIPNSNGEEDCFNGSYSQEPWDVALGFFSSVFGAANLSVLQESLLVQFEVLNRQQIITQSLNQYFSGLVQNSHVLAYRGICYVASPNYPLGASPMLPQINEEVISFNAFNVVPGQPDGDASIAIIDFLTNAYWGVGFPTNRLGALSGYPSSYASYCKSLGFAVSPVIASSVAASSVVSDICDATNSAACWQNGQLTIVPYGDAAVAQGSLQQITETYIVPPPDSNGNSHIVVGNVGTFVGNVGVNYFGGSAFAESLSMPPLGPGIYFEALGVYWFYVGVGGDTGQEIQITYTYTTASSYVPDTSVLYDFTIDDFLTNQGTIGTGLSAGNSPVLIVRKSRDQMLNNIKVEYLDRNNAYNPVDIEVKDMASIFQFGRIRASDIKQFHFFCLASAAVQSATLQLQRQQIARTYQWTCGAHFSMILQLMKIVTLTLSTMGLERTPVRIIEIQENTDQTLTITAEEYSGTASAPVYGVEANVGAQVNYNQDPGLVNTPIIFEPTDELGNALISGGGLMISIALSGSSSVWGGAQVWVSYDGEQYTNIGTIAAKARMGVLTAALGGWTVNEVGQTIDTFHTLAVDLGESGGVLASGSQLDATSLNLRCFVGPVLGQPGAGNGEIISYQTATLITGNQYGLTYLVRGAYGTEDEITAWPAGTGFARIDDSVFSFSYDKSRIGATLFIKFVGFNIYQGGLQSLGAVPAYNYTIQGIALSSPLPTITNLRTTFVNDRLAATWDEITDFRNGIRYEIRLGSNFDSALVLGTVAHPPYVLPGDGTYWFTGWVQPTASLIVRSETPVSIEVVGATLSSNIVASRDCKAHNWSGTLVNALIDTNVDAVRSAATDSAGVGSLVGVVTLTTSLPTAAGAQVLSFPSVPSNVEVGMGVADLTDSGAIPINTTVVGITEVSGTLTLVTLSLPIPFDWDPADFPPPDWASRGVLAGDSILFFNVPIIGNYTPDFTVNVGRVVSTTITISMTGQGIPLGQNILSDTNILTVTDILGASSSQFVDVYPTVSVSQDGITYAAPIRYSPGDYLGMAFQFGFVLESFDLRTAAYLESAVITVQVPIRIDHILTNGSLPSNGLTVLFTPDGSSSPAPFNGGPNNATVPLIIASWSDEQPGDVLSVTNLTDTGCIIQIKNAGAGVQRNQVNIYAEGY